MNGQEAKFYGKYRGVVTDNNDPESRARIRAKVKAVFGEEDSGWALPCSPYIGGQVGWIQIPPEGALVWIEFEDGNPEYPVWTGGFWANAKETPGAAATADVKVFKSERHTVELNDAKSTLILEAPNGCKILLGPKDIEITNGQGASIQLRGNQVLINDGALEVT